MFEQELHETRMKFQTELQTAKSEHAAQAASQPTNSSNKSIGALEAKLPKLVITKFDGSYQDWPRFWGQFIETIDKTGVASITKFAYLRELLGSKAKKSVEALPFTNEGYNRAKSILEDRYGKESEIVKAYTKEILELPNIPNANARKIHDFSEKLTYCVQALQTMKKLQEVNGNVAMTLDKLSGIRGDLVRTDPDWETWDFAQLSESLRQWTRRNPIDSTASERDPEPVNRRRDRPTKLYQARRQELRIKGCVYCEDSNHKSTECTKVKSANGRKQILMKRHLCFNCTGASHRASDCPSRTNCSNCDKRHHTSICEHSEEEKNVILTASGNSEGVFPVVVVKVDGITCRALIDSGAGSSYASAQLIDLLHKKPHEVKTKRVDMLMSSHVTKMETYEATVKSTDGDFQMAVNLTKVNKGELLSIDNPHYADLIAQYPHLKGVQINDHDAKQKLPVHVVLSGGEYARIKTTTKPHVGKDGEPIAEFTKLGWFIMSPGTEFDQNTMLLTQTSQSDYEELCRLDILGLADTAENDQRNVYKEFKEQLVRGPEGWYETGLPWRGNHPPLPTNETGKEITPHSQKIKPEVLVA